MDITKTLKAIIILDADGQQVICRAFDEQTSKREFEREIFIKTKSHRIKDEILTINGLLVVHKFITDLHIYVIGGKNENPLVLDAVLDCLVTVLTNLTNKTLDRQSFYINLTKIVLSFDEISDRGMLLETDPYLVTKRVCLKDDVMDQTTALQKLQSATEYVRIPWLRS